MQPVLERCDTERMPAYLNAGSARSRDLYLRHGFEVTEEFALPDGRPAAVADVARAAVAQLRSSQLRSRRKTR